MLNVFDVTEKIGNFVEKYTGSAYDYTEPTAPNQNDYTQVGEIFGYPIYVDNNDRYENEFLDFPTLSDILQTLKPTVSFEIKKGDCMVCLVIQFTLPLIAYPPITICLAKPECGKNENESTQDCSDEMPSEEEAESFSPLLPVCPSPDLPEDGDTYGEEGVIYAVELFVRNVSSSKSVTIINNGSPIETTDGYDVTYRAFGELEGPLTVKRRHIATYAGPDKNEKGKIIGYYNTTVDDIKIKEFNSFRGPGVDYVNSRTTNYSKTRFGTDSGGARDVVNIGTSVVTARPGILINGIPWKKKKKNIADTNPPIPSPETSMDCCEDIKKLLARQEKKIDSLVNAIKAEDFTKNKITIPANWIYPTTSDSPVVLEDIPDYLGAIARLIDRRMGAFPQVVKIKDAKPEEEGDQGDSIIVNSAADLQRATLEYLIASQASAGANQIMTLATLQESALTHYITASMERKIQAMVEYLDFELDEKAETLRMACNPTAVPEEGEELSSYLSKLVKPHEQPIETTNWKGGESLKDMLMDMRSKLIYAASAVTETRDPDKVVEQYLQLQRLLRLLNVREIDERLGVKDLKNFFDESEKGFPDSNLPKKFKEKPYGFGATELPKFAQLTSKSKKTKYKKPKPDGK